MEKRRANQQYLFECMFRRPLDTVEHCRRVLYTIAELHRRGYHGLRIRAGVSPSGCAWRCQIDAAVPRGYGGAEIATAKHGSGYGEELFGWNDTDKKDTAELASMFIDRFPSLCAAALIDDPEYVSWFEEMLRTTEPRGLPVSYADYKLDNENRQPIVGTSSGKVPLPPPLPSFDDTAASSLSRAQGCMFGQLAGDSLGSRVEFLDASEIAKRYPEGVTTLIDGGCWGTLAGQPTDDSEMALVLARSIVREGTFDPASIKRAYRDWFQSEPFDCGTTIAMGLSGRTNPASQANGALMRISPLGIFGTNHTLQEVADWAMEDARITHPHPVCQQANALFAMAISYAIRECVDGATLYRHMLSWMEGMHRVDDALRRIILAAEHDLPRDYMTNQGWVLIAMQNAWWQLLHAPSLEQGVVDTVARGGDTDTNAAICGALLGAVYGMGAIPKQWRDAIIHCRPDPSDPKVKRPRPKRFWPCDAINLASRLICV